MADREVLIREPEELAREKQVIEETIKDIGEVTGKEITPRSVKTLQFEDREDFDEIYHEIYGPRDFESEFDKKRETGWRLYDQCLDTSTISQRRV